jgi:uncharacterized protein (DUF1015 family)
VPGVNIHERLSAAFTIQPCELNPEKMQDLPREDRPVFGLYVRGAQECSILKYKGGALPDIPLPLRRLDVVVLHELILKRTLGVTDVAFEMDPWKAIRQVQAEGFDAAFFLNPTSVGDVKRVALANFRMPPKSTYFYPKLLTGLVINSFKNF